MKRSKELMLKLKECKNDYERGYLAYEYYQFSGYPPEFLAEELGVSDIDKYNRGAEARKEEHVDISRAGADVKFKRHLGSERKSNET